MLIISKKQFNALDDAYYANYVRQLQVHFAAEYPQFTSSEESPQIIKTAAYTAFQNNIEKKSNIYSFVLLTLEFDALREVPFPENLSEVLNFPDRDEDRKLALLETILTR